MMLRTKSTQEIYLEGIKKMKTFKLVDLINKMSLFEEISVCLFKNNNVTEEGKSLLIALFHTKKVDFFCLDCEKDRVFSVNHFIKRHNNSTNPYEINYIGPVYKELDDKLILDYSVKYPPIDEGVIEYSFICSMNGTHHYEIFFSFSLKNEILTIKKIGQSSLVRELKTCYSNEYKKVLERFNAFEDYRHYEQSVERGLLAGACTYLRRVFEKMVNNYFDESHTNNKDKYLHFDEKLKLVLNRFDVDIQPVLHESYSLLSKGIHELNDDEINDFYSLMAEVINIQLESEKEKKYRENKMKELRKNIKQEMNDKK